MQRVVLVNPDWKKGYVDKFLVCDLPTDTVLPIKSLDTELLAHTQEAPIGSHLIRIRQNLKDNTLSEQIFIVGHPKPILVRSTVEPGEVVEAYLKDMRDKQLKLFSIFRGNKMTQLEFDCPVGNVNRFLAPLKAADKEMYDFIYGELKYSKKSDCDTSWGKAGKLPKWLNVRERLVTDNDSNTVLHTSEHWLLIHAGGRVELPELAPTKGARINHETQRTIAVYNAAPTPVADDVIKAVRITIGVNYVDDKLRGIALKLYRK